MPILRFSLTCATATLMVAALFVPGPALSSGGMGIPSSGSIGTTGYFLSCRSTSSSTSATDYYDQANVRRTWNCGSGKRPHKGVDILGSTTPGVTPVYAAAAGKVWSAERGNGFGWRVVLRHGKNVGGNGRWTYTIYGHMGRCDPDTGGAGNLIDPAVKPGAAVAAGQLLGYQGNDAHPNGCTSRSHVHWEVRASDSDVSNVFLAIPASPDFYTGVQLTADDPNKVSSVKASAPAPTATPTARPTVTPTLGPTATPTATPRFTPPPRPTRAPRATPTRRPIPTRRPARGRA